MQLHAYVCDYITSNVGYKHMRRDPKEAQASAHANMSLTLPQTWATC